MSKILKLILLPLLLSSLTSVASGWSFGEMSSGSGAAAQNLYGSMIRDCLNVTCVWRTIDYIDARIVRLLAIRMTNTRRIAELQRNKPYEPDEARDRQILTNAEDFAIQQGADAKSVLSIYKTIIDQTNSYEKEMHSAFNQYPYPNHRP